jgi:hypothetical protein
MNDRPPSQSEIDYSCPVEIDTRRPAKGFATRIVLLIWVVALVLWAFTIWGWSR